VPITSQTEWFL